MVRDVWVRANFFLGGVVVMLIVVVFLGPFIRGRTEKTPVTAEQAQASTTDPEQGFFAFAEKLSQDETQKQKYLDVIEKLSHLVSAEAKKNPAGMSSYIEDIIPLIAKAGPGAELLAEEYASEAVREEMKRLRQDSNVVKLVELEKKNADLQEELNKIKEPKKNADDKDTVILDRLNAYSYLLKTDNDSDKKSDQRIGSDLEKLERFANLTKDSGKKQEYLNRIGWIRYIKKELEKEKPNGVPVIFVNSGFVLSIKVASQSSGSYWYFRIYDKEESVINLPDGEYKVLYMPGVFNHYSIKTADLVVNKSADIDYGGKKFHGIVILED